MKIYSNIEKSRIINKNYRNSNIQKEKKFLEKLKEINELSTKIYFIILISLLFLDYSLLINLFNIETGYFNIILFENIFLPFNLIYIIIPYIFIFIFIFSGILSLQLSLIIQDIIDEFSSLLKQINIFRCENKQNSSEKFQEIYKLIWILIISCIIIFFLEKVTNIIDESFKISTFTKSFMIVMIEFIILKGIFSFLSLHYLKSDKLKSFFEIFIVLIMCLLLSYNYYNKSNYFVLFLYVLYHMFAEIHYSNYFNKKSILTNKRNNRFGILFKVITIFFIIILFYSQIDSDNIKKWSQPIKINYDKKAFLNGSYNLIFNRGLLLNNKELIEIKIPEQHFKYLDISSSQYIRDNSCQNEQSFVIYKLLDDVQYLQLSKNLKMYFKSINFEKNENRTLIFLIKKEQEKIELIELSEYQNKVDKK